MALPPFNPSDLSFALPNPPQNPNPNPNPLLSVSKSHSPRWRLGRRGNPRLSTAVSLKATRSGSKYAVLGAGFAGLSVAWHLLKNSRKGCDVQVDVFDENGIGGGASGVAGGLLHPYSPKAKLLWKGVEFWKECLELLAVAEQANSAQIKEGSANADGIDGSIILRRGILRPATSRKNVEILME